MIDTDSTLYLVQDTEDGLLVFQYRTNQGNKKKAIFRHQQDAQRAVNAYMGKDRFRVLEIYSIEDWKFKVDPV